MPLYNMDNAQGQSEERFVSSLFLFPLLPRTHSLFPHSRLPHQPTSLLRERILTTLRTDALPPSSSLSSPSIAAAHASHDKLLLTLIQTACKASKLERALDYTSMLSSSASYKLAERMAAFYHLRGLGGKMAGLRGWKEREERGELGEDEEGEGGGGIGGRGVREGWGRIGEAVPRTGVAVLPSSYNPNSSSTSSHSNSRNGGGGGGYGTDYNTKHSLDFPPPPIVPRRSLAAAPAYSHSSSSALPSSSMPSSYNATPSSPPSSYMDSTQDSASTIGGAGQGAAKRKRDGEEGLDWESAGASKRRASPPTNAARGAVGAAGKGSHSSLILSSLTHFANFANVNMNSLKPLRPQTPSPTRTNLQQPIRAQERLRPANKCAEE